MKKELKLTDSKIDIAKVRLKKTLANFGIKVKVKEVNIGLIVTQFILQPEEGVDISKVVNLEGALDFLMMAYGLKIDASFLKKGLISIEIPNNILIQYNEDLFRH